MHVEPAVRNSDRAAHAPPFWPKIHRNALVRSGRSECILAHPFRYISDVLFDGMLEVARLIAASTSNFRRHVERPRRVPPDSLRTKPRWTIDAVARRLTTTAIRETLARLTLEKAERLARCRDSRDPRRTETALRAQRPDQGTPASLRTRARAYAPLKDRNLFLNRLPLPGAPQPEFRFRADLLTNSIVRI